MDMAYQGFADGIEADAAAPRLLASAGLSFLLATSFSKSFSLYGERVGALTLVTTSDREAGCVLSQVKRVVRTNYSSPPTHGGAVVALILSSPELRRTWETDLVGMRDRIHRMRSELLERLRARDLPVDLTFIQRQRGMFSYTGLTAAQVDRLRAEYGIYAVSTGRICVAALNSRNIDYVAEALGVVLKN
jgi:aromatic-amino-acid transaminase